MHPVPYIWEMCLFFFLLGKYSKNEFDRAHRSTVGSYRFPSFLWYFAPYFTWGPMASGETVPLRFLSVLSWKGRLLEIVRMIFQRTAFLDPFILIGLLKANEIGVATTATKNILPPFARKKSYVDLDFFKIDLSDFDQIDIANIKKDEACLKLLYVGKIVEWKGLMFVFRALKDFSTDTPYEFNIIGDGPDISFFQSYSIKHKLNVNFLGKKSRNELSHYYLTHDLFISPDIHGRGSNTIVEAKNHHLPVLMLDVTDPDGLTGKELNIIINTQNKKIADIIQSIKQSLINIGSDKKKTRMFI